MLVRKQKRASAVISQLLLLKSTSREFGERRGWEDGPSSGSSGRAEEVVRRGIRKRKFLLRCKLRGELASSGARVSMAERGVEVQEERRGDWRAVLPLRNMVILF